MKAIMVNMPDEVHTSLRKLSFELGMPMAEIIRQGIHIRLESDPAVIGATLSFLRYEPMTAPPRAEVSTDHD